MKNVLIIARYSGSRIPGLLKNLPDFGWKPVLLTPSLPAEYDKLPGISVIATQKRVENYLTAARGKSAIGRLLSLGGELINYPDSYKNWKKPAVRAAGELFKKEKIDAILSSSFPVTAHIIARELKARYRIPWLADLRDLWSQNHNYYYSRVRKWFDRRLELKTLTEADALVTVSQPFADKLNALDKGKIISTITNGFDEELVKEISVNMKPGFTLTYTGNIYQGKQHPGRLLKALSELIDEGAIDRTDIDVRFYGPVFDWLEQEIAGYDLSGVVKQYGLVSPEEAIRKQKESQVLLLLDWDDPGEMGVCPLKTFEYLGSSRPVLAVGGNRGNAVDSILEETSGGVHAVTDDEIKKTIKRLYQEYKQKGQVAYHGVSEEINKYTHRKMTGKFVDILQRIFG